MKLEGECELREHVSCVFVRRIIADVSCDVGVVVIAATAIVGAYPLGLVGDSFVHCKMDIHCAEFIGRIKHHHSWSLVEIL